jgi:hypothetical protein
MRRNVFKVVSMWLSLLLSGAVLADAPPDGAR